MPNKPKYKVHGIRCSEEEWKAMLETLNRLRGVNTQVKEVLTPSGDRVLTPIEKVKEEEDSLIAVCPECGCEFLLGTKNVHRHGRHFKPQAEDDKYIPESWKDYQ